MSEVKTRRVTFSELLTNCGFEVFALKEHAPKLVYAFKGKLEYVYHRKRTDDGYVYVLQKERTVFDRPQRLLQLEILGFEKKSYD